MRLVRAVALCLCGLLVALAFAPLARSQGKTVFVGLGQEPDRLFNTTTLAGALVRNALFDPLVRVDERMKPVPWLAVEVPTFENGGARLVGEGMDQALQVTFRLREGVTWSDGQPFTSEDVKATWELIMNPLSGFDARLEEQIDRIDTPDPRTVVITYLSANAARRQDARRYASLSGPLTDPHYFIGLNLADEAIYPAHVLRAIVGGDLRTSPRVQQLASSEFSRNPVGTGPYVVESWDPGVQLVLRARADSWRAPNIDTLVFRVAPVKDEAISALQAGQLDVLTQDVLDSGDAPVLDTLAGIRAYYTPGTVWEHLTFNLDHPILKDRAVRQAIAYGLNRDELNELVLRGKGEVAHSQVPSWSWAYAGDVPRYEHDPNRAAELLDRAGWVLGGDGVRVRDGRRLSLKYWSSRTPLRLASMPLVSDQLARLGVELQIEFVPRQVFFDERGSQPQSLAARQFEVAQFAWVFGLDPGRALAEINHSRAIPAREGGYRGYNYAGFRHPRVDELLDLGLATLDGGLRMAIYREVQSILAEELPILPLTLLPITSAATERLVNYKPAMSAGGETWNIHEWDFAQ